MSSFIPPTDDPSLKGRVMLLAAFAGLVAGYHLVSTVRYEVIAIINEYFFLSFYTVKAFLYPLIALYGARQLLRLRFIGWVAISFWIYSLILSSLYRLRWVDFGNRFTDGGQPGEFAITLESVLFSIALYIGVQVLLNTKQIVSAFGIDTTYKRMPLVAAVILFLVDLLISSYLIGV